MKCSIWCSRAASTGFPADAMRCVGLRRLVGGPDERTRRDVAEAQLPAPLGQLVEMLRRDIGHDLGVLPGRLEVLTQHEDIDADGSQIPHARHDLVVRLAEAELGSMSTTMG